MSYVVDASIVIGLLANRQADEELRRRLGGVRSVHAPALIDAEVASGVRGLLLGKKIAKARAADMLSDFAAIRITRHAMPPYFERVLELRANFSAYDAFYVALAEASELPLLTRDLRLARAAGHVAVIQLHSE